MEKIILSICIPTYNGGERLEKLVKHILRSDRTDIEIAISDNQSTDNTAERINGIRDRRVRFYENEQNLGSLGNGIRALQNGQGEYLMLLIDRDIVQPEYVDEYTDFLKINSYDVIINQAQILRQNICCELAGDRKYYYLFKSPHPSYYVFRKACFDKVEIVDMIKKNGYYPALIGMTIAEQYGGTVYLNGDIPIILQCEPSYVSMHGSRSWSILGELEKSKLRNGTFEPKSQMGLLENYLRYLKYMDVVGNTLNDALFGIYHALLENAMDYIHVMESSRMRYRYPVPDLHYEMEDHLGIADEFLNAFDAYVQKLGFQYDKSSIELLTELVKLQFTNSTISQTYVDFENNEKRISQIKRTFAEKGLCEDVVEMNHDINLKEGIGNTKGLKK